MNKQKEAEIIFREEGDRVDGGYIHFYFYKGKPFITSVLKVDKIKLGIFRKLTNDEIIQLKNYLELLK